MKSLFLKNEADFDDANKAAWERLIKIGLLNKSVRV